MHEAQPNQELDEMRERIRQSQEQVSQTAQLNRELQRTESRRARGGTTNPL